MIAIKVILKIPADKIEEGKAAYISSQNKVVKEEGCLSFRMYQDIEDPTVFFLFEEWETQALLEAHWENGKKPAAPDALKWPESIGEVIAIRYDVASYGDLWKKD
jgi:quinol monooxygenase YgiN